MTVTTPSQQGDLPRRTGPADPGDRFQAQGQCRDRLQGAALAELFRTSPLQFFGNPNLKPETSIGYDLGFEQAAFERRARFGATYFHNNIDNLITINSTSTSFENVGKATTYGVEELRRCYPLGAAYVTG